MRGVIADTSSQKLLLANGQRSLAACADSVHGRKLQAQAADRRAATIAQLRIEQRGRRQLDSTTVLATSHKSQLEGVTTEANAKTLFESKIKCILEPEVTQGPYYVSGELIRTDIRERQAGVDLYTELQIIDVNTCEPVENFYLDFWHCNSTGVYSGVVAKGNGDSSDRANINTTFHRGLAPTNAEGLVTFRTIFPGHYAGRAPHIHVLGTHNGNVLKNHTYVGGVAAHVGQIFFDQSLIASVEATTAYVANKQSLTTNDKDRVLAQSAATGFDPFVEYALLGDNIEDGIFSWISIGIDMAISKSVLGAATLTATGGVSNAKNAGTGDNLGGKQPDEGRGLPPADGFANSSTESPASSSPTSPPPKPHHSYLGRNLAILFLCALVFLMSPYNRWIPIPCRPEPAYTPISQS
uniref:Uncharacterized protein n=1 Tax=Globisporangium ultimum (strain ATCC 200006 / CBS 805.95 / DAOM BR144) TaxID=431595 RepID=K3XBQ9_GLOUD